MPKLSGFNVTMLAVFSLIFIFGPKRLPEVANSVGRTVAAFRDGLKG